MTVVLSVQAPRETLDIGGESTFLEEYEMGPYERRVPIEIKGSNMKYKKGRPWTMDISRRCC